MLTKTKLGIKIVEKEFEGDFYFYISRRMFYKFKENQSKISRYYRIKVLEIYKEQINCLCTPEDK